MCIRFFIACIYCFISLMNNLFVYLCNSFSVLYCKLRMTLNLLNNQEMKALFKDDNAKIEVGEVVSI